MRAVFQNHIPTARVFLVAGGGDATPELDVAAQIELVSNVVEIALGLGLSGEVFLPVPFLQHFPGKRIAIGPALGVEAGAGIAVPVPGAADGAAGLEHPHFEAEFAQPVELVEAGNARADDDRVEIQARLCRGSVGNCRRSVHAVLPHPSNRSHHPRRSNRRLSESRAAADCIARLSGPTVSLSMSCECAAAVITSSSSHDGDRTGTDTWIMP